MECSFDEYYIQSGWRMNEIKQGTKNREMSESVMTNHNHSSWLVLSL